MNIFIIDHHVCGFQGCADTIENAVALGSKVLKEKFRLGSTVFRIVKTELNTGFSYGIVGMLYYKNNEITWCPYE